MSRYNVNERVIIVKENDRYEGKCGVIESIAELVHCPVTIYYIKFDDGRIGYYFFGEIEHK